MTENLQGFPSLCLFPFLPYLQISVEAQPYLQAKHSLYISYLGLVLGNL